jgi:hypothetical protein
MNNWINPAPSSYSPQKTNIPYKQPYNSSLIMATLNLKLLLASASFNDL